MHARTQIAAAALTLLVVGAGVAPIGAMALNGQTGTYAGTHVTFETEANAMTAYAVDGETMISAVKTESKSHYESRTGVSLGLDVSTVTHLQGSALTVNSKTNAGASVSAENGAKLHAHDNPHGILVAESGGQAQLVKANVSASSSAEQEGDSRVVVTTDNDKKGTFIVVGEGSVDVNSEGDVVANVGDDGKLVFRAYSEDERDDAAKAHEKLIANGSAAGEVYVMTEDGGETVTDTVQYSQNTTITAEQTAENEVQMTVERTEHEGKVVLTQVSEAAVGAADSIEVAVDGESAVRASSYSEVVAASNGGEASKYVVRQTAQMQAEGQAEVLVGVNHFSSRTITMTGNDSGTTGTATPTATGGSDGTTATDDGAGGSDGTESASGSDGSGDDSTSTSTPGFGLGVALIALVAAGLFAVRND